MWSTVFDNSKIKSFVPGFQSTIPFEKGIQKTVEWFEEDKSRQRINEEVNIEMDQIIKAYRL